MPLWNASDSANAKPAYLADSAGVGNPGMLKDNCFGVDNTEVALSVSNLPLAFSTSDSGIVDSTAWLLSDSAAVSTIVLTDSVNAIGISAGDHVKFADSTGTAVSATRYVIQTAADDSITIGQYGNETVGLSDSTDSSYTRLLYVTPRASTNKFAAQGVAHTGWVQRHDKGGGRYYYETLVAGGMSGDASDDSATKFPDSY